MPLRRADLRIVTVKRQLAPDRCAQDERPVFEENGRAVSARILPLGGSTAARVYGEEVTRMLAMFTQSDIRFEEGMGVCINGENGACDYRVAEPPQRWRSHARLTLKAL